MSITSTYTAETNDAERIIKRLTNHWRHKLTIEEVDGASLVHFSEQAVCRLIGEPNRLLAILTADTTDELDRLESVVDNHLTRMAKEELTGQWLRD